MPQDPIDFRILRDLQDALQRIGGSNYHYAVMASAVRLDPNGDIESLIAPDGPRPFMVLEVLPDEREYFPQDEMKVLLPVRLHWISESTPTDDASRLQVFLRGCADVETAISVDRSRGQLALDTLIRRRTFDTAVDGSQVWALLEIEIEFYRTNGQPNGVAA